jgi:hypothetical protein
LRESWLNALYWYYIGGCEVSDARSVICYSSCLESLVSGYGAKDIIELCENLFDMDSGTVVTKGLELTLKDAVHRIYNSSRSEVAHGGRFVLSYEYTEERAIAAQLSRYVLLRCQECLVEFEGKHGEKGAADRKDVFVNSLKAARRLPSKSPATPPTP